jgi:predicted ATP-grasp superfamily ATP-dependent carboligase
MEITLKKEIHKPIIIQGFPSFGLIGSIITEYLISQLQAVQIGTIYSKEFAPLVGIHEGKIILPVTLYYAEQYNLVLIHAIGNFNGLEYNLADCILELCQKTNAYELISVEGISDPTKQTQTQVFQFTNHTGIEQVPVLQDGVIMGLTATLLQRAPSQLRQTTLLATSHSQLPDSHAAACILRVLDNYLHFDVDPQPLEIQAKAFEGKLQQMMLSMKQSVDEAEKKQLSYVG